MTTPVGTAMQVHIAGGPITVDGRLLRQRCGWCGATLIDYNLNLTASMDGQPPATWPVGGLIAVDGVASWIVEADGDRLPAEACAQLDPQVTR